MLSQTTRKKPMNTPIKTLFLAIFTFFINCTSSQVNLRSLWVDPQSMTGIYTSNSVDDFNDQLFESSSTFRLFLNVRILPNDSKIERTEMWITSQKEEFLKDQKRIFPKAKFQKYKIETRTYSGQLVDTPGPTGFVVKYINLKFKTGLGDSIESALEQYNIENFDKLTIARYEKWETVSEGIWLSEEKEESADNSYFWNHKPGSFDFLHRYTNFKSGSTSTASINYDYDLNLLKKLKIEKNPYPSNLVFEEKDKKLYFNSGKISLQP